MEPLEARAVPAVFNPTTPADLVAAIRTANGTPEADTIVLSPGAIKQHDVSTVPARELVAFILKTRRFRHWGLDVAPLAARDRGGSW